MLFLGKVVCASAIAMCLLAAHVARHYHWNETFLYNMAFFMNGYIFAYPPLDQTMEEHVAHFAKTTAGMEASATEFNAKVLGDAFYKASYGENATQVVELTVPSSTTKDYDIPVLCAAPPSTSVAASLPLILYSFGGGFVLGSPKGELLMIRWMAQEAHAIVCSVEYRLAPQCPYPIPIQDSLDGSIGILTTHASELETQLKVKLNQNRVGVYGISAGGYMAAQMARRLPHKLTCQVLLVPMVKAHGGTASAIQYWDHRLWGGFKNGYSWNAFLPGDDGTLAADWKVSLLADPPEKVWSNLPPAYLQIHTRDLLRDEGEMYSNKLQVHGKLIGVDEYDTSHIGGLPGISNGGAGDGAMAKAARVLKEQLHKK